MDLEMDTSYTLWSLRSFYPLDKSAPPQFPKFFMYLTRFLLYFTYRQSALRVLRFPTLPSSLCVQDISAAFFLVLCMKFLSVVIFFEISLFPHMEFSAFFSKNIFMLPLEKKNAVFDALCLIYSFL